MVLDGVAVELLDRLLRLLVLDHGEDLRPVHVPARLRDDHGRDYHAILAAAAPSLGFQTVVLPGSPGYALYPSAQVARSENRD